MKLSYGDAFHINEPLWVESISHWRIPCHKLTAMLSLDISFVVGLKNLLVKHHDIHVTRVWNKTGNVIIFMKIILLAPPGHSNGNNYTIYQTSEVHFLYSVVFCWAWFYLRIYRNISDISCTKFPNLNVSHLVLQLYLPRSAPIGDDATKSELSTMILPTKCILYQGFDDSFYRCSFSFVNILPA